MDEESSTSQSGRVLTITDLIRAKLDGGKSVRELARDSGGRVKYQTFDDLSRTAPKAFPKDMKTVAGMSAALDVSETAVVLAYAASLGADVRVESMLAQQLPRSTERLRPEMRNVIVALINAATIGDEDAGTAADLRSKPTTPPEEPRASSPSTEDKKNKPDDLTGENQGLGTDRGAQSDYDLAGGWDHRIEPGGTVEQQRRRHEPQPEDENQDSGSDEPA